MKPTYIDDPEAALAQLREEYADTVTPDTVIWCLHCESSFKAKDVRRYKFDQFIFLECGTKDCDGSPLDWADVPWWDADYKDE